MLPRGMLPAGVDGARSTPTRAQLSLANPVAASFKQLGGGPLVGEDGGVAATGNGRIIPRLCREREKQRRRERVESEARPLAEFLNSEFLISQFLEGRPDNRGCDLCNNRFAEITTNNSAIVAADCQMRESERVDECFGVFGLPHGRREPL